MNSNTRAATGSAIISPCWMSWSNTGWRSLLTATVPVRYVRTPGMSGLAARMAGTSSCALSGGSAVPMVAYSTPSGVARSGPTTPWPSAAAWVWSERSAAARSTGAEPVGRNTTVKLESSRSWKFFCRIASALADSVPGRSKRLESRSPSFGPNPPYCAATATNTIAIQPSTTTHRRLWTAVVQRSIPVPVVPVKRSRPSGGSRRARSPRSPDQP